MDNPKCPNCQAVLSEHPTGKFMYVCFDCAKEFIEDITETSPRHLVAIEDNEEVYAYDFVLVEL